MSLVFEKDLLDRCDTLFMELHSLHGSLQEGCNYL